MSSCDDFQKLATRAVLGDASLEEQEALELHLRNCIVCRSERDRALEALNQLRLAGDAAVPRHFFVHAESNGLAPWSLFRELTMTWKLGFAAVALGIVLLAVFAATNFHARIGDGVYEVSFGRQIDPKPQSSPASMDVEAVKAELLRILDNRFRQERLQWIEAIKREPNQPSPALSPRQQRELAIALGSLEYRLDQRMLAAGAALQSRWDKSLTEMYDSVQVQRQRDLLLAQERFNRMRTQDEIKTSQTDAILETLLQVAEVRLK